MKQTVPIKGATKFRIQQFVDAPSGKEAYKKWIYNFIKNTFYPIIKAQTEYANRIMTFFFLNNYMRVDKAKLKDFDYSSYKGTLKSYIRDEIYQRVFDKYKVLKKGFSQGDVKIANWKAKDKIFFRDRGYKIYKNDEEKLIAELSIFDTKLKLLLFLPHEAHQIILERLLNGEYKLGNAFLQRKTSKWFLGISYTGENEIETDFLPNRILGVDIGVHCPFACSVLEHADDIQEDNSEMVAVNWNFLMINKWAAYELKYPLIAAYERLYKRQQDMQKMLKQELHWRGGRGKRNKFRAIKKLSGRWDKFSTLYNHRLTRAIIEYAKNNKCGVIAMKEINKDQEAKDFFSILMRRTWKAYEFQTFLAYKAKQEGLEIIKIPDRDWNRICFHCGFHNEYYTLDYRMSKNYPRLQCLGCGISEDGEVNAASNIGKEGYIQVRS